MGYAISFVVGAIGAAILCAIILHERIAWCKAAYEVPHCYVEVTSLRVQVFAALKSGATDA